MVVYSAAAKILKYGRCLNLFSVLLSEYGQRKHLTRRLTRTLNQDKSTRLGCSIVVANRLIFSSGQ